MRIIILREEVNNGATKGNHGEQKMFLRHTSKAQGLVGGGSVGDAGAVRDVGAFNFGATREQKKEIVWRLPSVGLRSAR